jgi:hypothetical protein
LQDSAIYLGVALHRSLGHTFGLKQRALAAMRAVTKVHSILQHVNIGKHAFTSLQLIAGIIRPALSYGAELSGLSYVCPTNPRAPLSAAEALYLKQLSAALCLGKGTPRPVLYREAGQVPMPADWLAAACRLYNRMSSAACPLMRTVMQQAIANAFPRSWGSQFKAALSDVGFPDVATHLLRGLPVHAPTAASQFAQCYHDTWHTLVSDPRNPSCQHRRLSTYALFFDAPSAQPALPWYISHIHSRSVQALLSKVRCCASRLVPVDALRFKRVPFTDRLCALCHTGVADISHICFECMHPSMHHIRAAYQLHGCSMHTLTLPNFPQGPAVHFLIDCINTYTSANTMACEAG